MDERASNWAAAMPDAAGSGGRLVLTQTGPARSADEQRSIR